MLLRRAAVFGFVLLLAGCAAEPAEPPLYPLAVTVVQNGKPVAVGGLIFVPESGDWGCRVVNASPGPDGAFTAQTSRATGHATTLQPGAPAGRYKVAYHPVSDGQKMGLEYEFPDAIEVGAKDNALTLVLPDRLPGDEHKQGKAGGANPADRTDD